MGKVRGSYCQPVGRPQGRRPRARRRLGQLADLEARGATAADDGDDGVRLAAAGAADEVDEGEPVAPGAGADLPVAVGAAAGGAVEGREPRAEPVGAFHRTPV